MSPLSVENNYLSEVRFIKNIHGPMSSSISTSAAIDKILSFIKSVSFRPAGEIFIHSIEVRFLPLVEMTQIVFVIPHLTVT